MAGEHADRGHALNGPSTLHRRLPCSGSYAAEKDIPEPPSTALASEGTYAHEGLELVLRGGNLRGDEPPDMVAAIMDAVRWVQTYQEKGYNLYVEVEVDPALALENDETWGTADIILLKEGHLIVADFKYGRYPVSPIGNPQLLAYAGGAINTLQLNGTATVTLAILQPRLPMGPSASTTELTINQLVMELKDMAQRLHQIQDNPILVPGDHCKFCKARIDCPARLSSLETSTTDAFALAMEAETASAGNSVAQLPDAELSKFLDKLPLLESVIADVRTEVMSRIRKGAHIAGYKIIRGPGGRKWVADPEELEKLFKSRGFTKADYEVIKLASPAQIEKLDKYKDFSDKKKQNVIKLWTKTPGGEKLVTEETRGPAIDFDAGESFAKADEANPDAEPVVVPAYI